MARGVSRGTRRNGGGSRQRRKLIWARLPLATVTAPAGTGVVLPLLSNFETEYGAQLIGCTVMRIHGWWCPEGLGAGEQMLAGIRVVDDSMVFNAAAQGPLEDPHADWMYYDVVNENITTAAGGRYFDVKAMRKFEELGQGLSMVFEGNNAASEAIDVVTSVLVALP